MIELFLLGHSLTISLRFVLSSAVDGAVSGKLQRPFDPGRPGEHVEQPRRGADLPVLLQSSRAAQMGRAAAAGGDPLAAPAEGGSGQSERRRAGPVEEGVEPRVLRPETGPHRVHEWTGLLVLEGGGGPLRLMMLLSPKRGKRVPSVTPQLWSCDFIVSSVDAKPHGQLWPTPFVITELNIRNESWVCVRWGSGWLFLSFGSLCFCLY